MIAKFIMTLSLTTLLTVNTVLFGWLAFLSWVIVRDALERTKEMGK